MDAQITHILFLLLDLHRAIDSASRAYVDYTMAMHIEFAHGGRHNVDAERRLGEANEKVESLHTKLNQAISALANAA